MLAALVVLSSSVSALDTPLLQRARADEADAAAAEAGMSSKNAARKEILRKAREKAQQASKVTKAAEATDSAAADKEVDEANGASVVCG